MTIADASQVMLQLVSYCMPTAFIINIVSWGCNAILSAVTGKGIKL